MSKYPLLKDQLLAEGVLAAGDLPQSGFIRQEDIALDAFLANRFGRLYLAESANAAVA